ncbi:MAG: hypothetical protein QNK37_20590 [Acidobacteriota bacterium]|nr:hypothetical protein [Acidobacteriota bacterium]
MLTFITARAKATALRPTPQRTVSASVPLELPAQKGADINAFLELIVKQLNRGKAELDEGKAVALSVFIDRPGAPVIYPTARQWNAITRAWATQDIELWKNERGFWARRLKEQKTMQYFHGNLSWVHKWEGHIGKPYWPKGKSGITLDPGVDLGYVAWGHVKRAYGSLLTDEQLENLRKAALGLRGIKAREMLEWAQKNEWPFTTIRITREQAAELFHVIAVPYWLKICNRFPVLRNENTPGGVQTALLSLAYNRGPGNRHLECLGPELQKRRWRAVAGMISNMQQNHELEGIRRRRREEAELILKGLTAN